MLASPIRAHDHPVGFVAARLSVPPFSFKTRSSPAANQNRSRNRGKDVSGPSMSACEGRNELGGKAVLVTVVIRNRHRRLRPAGEPPLSRLSRLVPLICPAFMPTVPAGSRNQLPPAIRR
jgi:hypothetical protein